MTWTRVRLGPLLGLVIFLAGPVTSTAQEAEWEWTGVSRVVALGDVHGSYDKMVALLEGTGLVDDRLRWIGGEDHLVLCGDLTDRGSDDRGVMDLAHRLQGEAETVGGKVHVLLGNHEVMNLTRDRRYWDSDLLDEFAPDESDEERKAALERYRAAEGGRFAGDEQAFDDAFPAGYFARARAFEPDGEYGSWLLEQPTVVKINGVLFLHGGLTPRVARLGLSEINRQMIAGIRAHLAAADDLAEAVAFPGDMTATMQTAYTLASRGGRNPKVRSAEAVVAAQEGLAFDAAGPIWYRGTAIENERLEGGLLAEVLERLGARGKVMGHTVTRTGRLSSRFNGTVFRADVGMGYGRPPLAAVIEGGSLRVYDPATGSMAAPWAEPPQGEGWPTGEEDLADHVLETFLEKATIKSASDTEFDGVPARILQLERKDMKLRAVFGAARETAAQAAAAGRKGRRRYQHQVAAYRLDRQLGLNMVPVTVLRTIEKTEGMVQIWIQGALDLQQLQEYDDFRPIEGLGEPIAKARAFTALIGLDLEDRVKAGKMVLPVSSRVMLADNGIAFTDEPTVGRVLPEGCGPVGPAFLHALEALDLATLKKDLAKLLTDAQMEAVLKRRDDLLRLCADVDAEWSVQKIIDMQPD